MTCVGAEGGLKIREAPVCSDSGEGLLSEAETDPESHSEGPARDKRGVMRKGTERDGTNLMTSKISLGL